MSIPCYPIKTHSSHRLCPFPNQLFFLSRGSESIKRDDWDRPGHLPEGEAEEDGEGCGAPRLRLNAMDQRGAAIDSATKPVDLLTKNLGRNEASRQMRWTPNTNIKNSSRLGH